MKKARHGVSMKSMVILMVAFSVLGNVLYALAGLMHSKIIILLSRTLIGICQCQLAGPIYIARAVGVKRRTKACLRKAFRGPFKAFRRSFDGFCMPFQWISIIL